MFSSELDYNAEFQKILQQVAFDLRIIAVILFGSYARGEKFRDIDVCLVEEPESISPKEELAYRTKFSEPFEIHFFSMLPLYIQSRVIDEGIIILNKDYDRLFDVYMKTIRDYDLFRPHFEAFLGVISH
jgi:predicted nucleotidyltransferase